ncbi:MAG: hypothetical protein IKY84_05670 [Bacteroidaceae bacterium]|nr:hypothetical protein [Bacteroidaceae bacterium]
MKNNLRLLCVGLAATAMLTATAQVEDMTSRLSNPDMELGIKHWNVGGDAVFGKVEKNQSSRPAYHGFHGKALENWNGGGVGLADNYISQTVRNLPSGIYVFGAYIAATFQEDNEVSNKDGVTGVSLFANDASIPVATDNPDKSEYKWAHTGKFNVAVTLPEAGNLRVGIKTESTNANFVIWDNATLYYFGNMSEADALNEMAKIDMAATLAIADTCLTHKMHVDTLAYLNDQIAVAKGVVTADAAWQADEDLYWAIRLANKSIGDYRRFNDVLLHADRVLAAEWSEDVVEQYTALQAMSAEYKELYEAATLVRDEVAEKVDLLGEAIAKVELDSLYIVFDEVDEFIDNLKEEGLVGEDPGMLSLALLAALESLREEAATALDAAMDGEKSAVETAQYITALHNAMQEILDNPNSVDTFPIVLTSADGLPGTEVNGQNTWESRLYTFEAPLTKVRFTVLDSNTGDTDGGGNKCFALAEFFMKDANGEQIYLDESMVATNACHNTLNSPDGQGVPGMLDGDNGTYFHSSWGASAGGAHYLEVTLPEGEYTSFSFGFVSRNWRTTPTHIEVNVISEWKNELMKELSLTKDLHAYHGSDPGFYTTDLTALYEAIAHAEAVIADENASDEDMLNAIYALEQARELVTEDLEFIYPEGGKTYRIVSANPAFYANQGVHKALSINNDVLWWENFAKDRQEQEFILEPIPSDVDAHYYEIKNVKSNRWIGRYESDTKLVLADEPDTIEVVPLGGGQFNLKSYGKTFHCNWHNNGTGVSEGICVWGGGFNTPSSWYILEVVELPLTRLVENVICYETVHLFEGATSITLTADKTCSFDGLTIYDYLGYKIDAEISIIGNKASFVMDESYNSFAFKFNNLEGITSIEISSGGMASLIALQNAYDAAIEVNPEEGKHVMQYADLSEYKDALAVAETLLETGGTDEQIVAAVAQLEKAVANLVPNMPDPNKTYFIISGLEAYEKNHDVPMMMYANESELRWSYENTEEMNRYWKFEVAPAEEGAEVSYYIKNVGFDQYVGDTPILVKQESAASYTITPLGGLQVAIAPLGQPTYRFHTNNHWGGEGKGSNIVFWNDGYGSASAWKICETDSYLGVDTQIEEMHHEPVAPAVKGIYDLFGRRVDNPTNGIYIIDGKKKLIK